MITLPITLNPGQYAQFDVFGRDANNNPTNAITSVTATINNYAAAFVNTYQGHWVIAYKAAAPGATVPVSVAFNAKDANGNALPTMTVTANIVGPPPPPPATSLDTANLAVGSLATASPAVTDPGSATV